MVRNLCVIGGSSHPTLTETICQHLGIPPSQCLLSKFAVGETRVEIGESVRGKDVYIIQSGGGKVNDHLMELLILISACKTASAKRVTAVLPIFPYSRQSDIPYNKAGAPLTKNTHRVNQSGDYTFDSRPATPNPESHDKSWLNGGPGDLHKQLASKLHAQETVNGHSTELTTRLKRSDTGGSSKSDTLEIPRIAGPSHDHSITSAPKQHPAKFEPQRGYKQWVAQAGKLVADLLTCAGADHVITMDLHDPQYQGFFDIPVDNLYGRHILKRYITAIPDYRDAVIVSPDAGGAKRATAIADDLKMPFALIHKERRPAQVTGRRNATMILVGQVVGRTAILIDDLTDTSNTITRAAELLKREGAGKVIALVTHGVLSGEALERINASALDRIVVTNSVDQSDHLRGCHKLEVLEVGHVFAEAIRRVHHGESISVLFQ